MKSSFSPIVLGCALFTVTGCASLDLPKWNRTDFIRADAKHPAAEIVCVWKPAKGTSLDGMPARGFAGQILFFNRRDAEPLVVDGDVRIFLYDDVGTAAEQAKPFHQFDFKPDSWNLHAKMTTLGPSYHVFIPYTRKDYGYRTNCALRVKLTPKKGPTIFSNVVSVPLPGPENPDKNVKAFTGRNINADLQYASDPSFQSRREKMQNLQQLVQEYMHSQKKPPRSSRVTQPVWEPKQRHIPSRSASATGFSGIGNFMAAGPLSGESNLIPQTLDSIQPIETTVHPLESDFDSQTENPSYQAEQHHPLLPASGFAHEQIHSFTPIQHTYTPRQFDRMPASHPLQPSFQAEQNSPRLHPLQQLQHRHPLEGFSSQSSSVGSSNGLKPKVNVNAAPLSQANPANGKLLPVFGKSGPLQNFPIDRRVSLLSR